MTEESPKIAKPYGARVTPTQAWGQTRQMLECIKDSETRAAYVAFHDENRELSLSMPASIKNHHAWPGGYAVHINEVLYNLSTVIGAYPLPKRDYELDDAVAAAYVHDIDKLLYRYEPDDSRPSFNQTKYAKDLGLYVAEDATATEVSLMIDAKKGDYALEIGRIPKHQYRKSALDFEDGAIVAWLCARHKLPISEMALHAVCVHHGGFSALARTSQHLKMRQLGVLLHAADLISASVQDGQPLARLHEPAKPEEVPA